MPILIYISWICYAAAALCIAAILSTESLIFLSPAIATALTGVLFAALERIIDTLIDIRDAVALPSAQEVGDGTSDGSKTASLFAPMQANSQGLVELQEKIERLKKQ